MADGYADYNSYLQGESQRQLANDIATQQYNASKAAGEADDRALNKAKFAWQQTMDRAGLTGKFEDQWTMPSQQWFTQQFGTWMPGGPQAGQQTMGREAQTFGQGATLAGLYGQAFAPGQGPAAGTQTLTAQQQAYAQWLGQQNLALAQQKQAQDTANQYLGLLSNLRGPADWAKYQEVLGATPGGMRDLVAAAMGQYVPGGGATTGVQPQAANLNTLMAQVGSGNAQAPWQQGTGVQMPGAPGIPSSWPQSTYTPMGGAGPMGTAPLTQAAVQQQAANQQAMQPTPAQNYTYGAQDTGSLINASGWGGATNPAVAAFTPGAEQAPQQFQQRGAVQGTGQQQVTPGQMYAQQAGGGGTNMLGAQQPGQPQANQMNLPAPNQIAAQSWKNMAPSQQQMMLGAYEAQGWHKPDVEALMNQALPKYAANAPSAGTWRMR